MSHLNEVNVVIAGHHVKIVPGLHKGSDLRAVGHVPEHEQLLLEVNEEIDVPVTNTDLVLIHGGEEFSVGGHPLPDNPDRICPLPIKVNHDRHEVSKAKLTFAEILNLYGPDSEGSMITLDIPHLADEGLPSGSRVVLSPHMVFLVTPCGNVGDNRIQSHFSELLSHYPQAKLVPLGDITMVTVPDFPLPAGWSLEKTDVMFLVPSEYPVAAPDMFYVSPRLALPDGGIPANATEIEQHGGKSWQRFSWHYTTPWKPSRGSLLSHLDFCRVRLKKLN